VREEVDSRGAKRRFKDDPLKLERIEDLGPDEVISVYTGRSVRGPVSRAPRAEHRADQTLQAAARRRSYWGRLAPPDAAMYLRTAGSPRTTSRATCAARGGKKRDPRVLGKQLDLFSIQEEVGPGWCSGTEGRDDPAQLRRLHRGHDFWSAAIRWSTRPAVTRRGVFSALGAPPAVRGQPVSADGRGEGEAESVPYRVKAMNCPMPSSSTPRSSASYRDLPVRLAEIANVVPQRALGGRCMGCAAVRGLTMDDDHNLPARGPDRSRRFSSCSISWSWSSRRTFGLSYRSTWRRAPRRS